MPEETTYSATTTSPRPIPKPHSALPSHLVNGRSPLHKSGVPNSATRAEERDKLASTIKSTYARRRSVEYGSTQLPSMSRSYEERGTSWTGLSKINGDESEDEEEQLNNIKRTNTTTNKLVQEPPRDQRDDVVQILPATQRPASPYTQNPPIDFDGLSWPCKFLKMEI